MSLGSGVYDVYLADRGGGNLLGLITGISSLNWGRKRDDVSTSLLTVQTPTPECAEMLQNARSIRNELVVHRNGKRVWEGPITRLEYASGQIEIGASDVLWFATHRVLTTGWDWKNTGTPGYVGHDLIPEALGLLQAVYGDGTSDPYGYQVGKFLQGISSSENPHSLGAMTAYSRTVWEVLDAWAEDSGLDYTVIGRKILWWGVHHRAFQLERLTDADFNDALVVTEYGMDLETRRYRTDNAGGVKYAVAPTEWLDYYGPVDAVYSAVDETVGAVVPVVTPGAPVLADLGAQYPAPVRIRLPENTGLSCDSDVDINQLVPGVWVPVYTTRTGRLIEQWMKLDSVDVTVGGDGSEVVAVSMSQAPDKAVTS